MVEYKRIQQEGFIIAGIAVRTSNDNAMQDIPPLWEKFHADKIMSRIPDKVDEKLYALYTDYEGDYTKPYTMVIGCKVSSTENLPVGLVWKSVPASQYAAVPVTGTVPMGIVAAWMEIWSSQLDRAYTGDLEVYTTHDDVEIHVAIKN